MTFFSYTPTWRKKLKEVCPEADTFIDDLHESIERYRHWVMKQNRDIDGLMTENTQLREKINELEIELLLIEDDERCMKIAYQAYVSEILNNENDCKEPF